MIKIKKSLKLIHENSTYSRVAILLILIIGCILYFFRLGHNPPGVLVDEASLGYNAYSILKSNHDEWGEKWPLTLKSFGDYKPAGYAYLAIPFISLFGLNPTSVRVPSAVAGIISIICLYIVVNKLFNNRKLALVTSLVFAVTPWQVYISRMAWEANVALSIFLLGLALLLTSRNRWHLILVSSFFFSSTMYIYIGYRLLTPLLLIFFFYYFLQKAMIPKITIFLAVAFFIIFSIPLIPEIFYKGGLNRFDQVSIYSQTGNIMYINEQRTFCAMQNNKVITSICYGIWNKPAVFAMNYLKNYFFSYSIDFLFLRGDLETFINNPDHGGFFLWLLPFFLFGLICIYKDKKKPSHKFILLWLILSPVMSALAGKPHFIRSNMVLIPTAVICSLGLYEFIELIADKIKVDKKIIYIFTAMFLVLNSFASMIDYFLIYTQKAMAWEEQYKPLFEYLAKVENNYQILYFRKMNRHPYIYQSFYQAIDPNYFQKNARKIDFDIVWIGKYHYIDSDVNKIYCIWQKTGKISSLYITANEKIDFEPQFWVNSANNVHKLVSVYDLAQAEKDMVKLNILPVCGIN